MFQKCFCIVFIQFLGYPAIEATSIEEITSVSHYLNLIVDIVWQLIKGDMPTNFTSEVNMSLAMNEMFKIMNLAQKELWWNKNVMKGITERLNNIDEDLRAQGEIIHKNLQHFRETIGHEFQIDHYLEYTNNIDESYEIFNDYITMGGAEISATANRHIEKHTLENFAVHTLSHASDSVMRTVKRLNKFILGGDRERNLRRMSLFESAKVIYGKHGLCDKESSMKQFVFNVYKDLMQVQLKAYTMIQYSYTLLNMYKKAGDFMREAQMAQKNFILSSEEQFELVKNVMKTSENEFYRCDPDEHVENKTHTEITRFMQGFVVNEVDLNPGGSCKGSCSKYWGTTYEYGCFKSNSKLCGKQPGCLGKIKNCIFVDSDMYICQSDNKKRRYNWIAYENGEEYGKKDTCPRGVTRVDSWWRWIFWHCSYCFCYCEDEFDSKSERYFSLQPVLSDKSQNRIVTGIKFIKKLKVIYLQIQQGKLVNNGQIDPETLEWKKIESFSVDHAEEGKDYYKLSSIQKSFSLGRTNAPPQHIVTGVRFGTSDNILKLEIEVTRMNFTNGELSSVSQWISWSDADNERLLLKNQRIPIGINGENVFKNNFIIEFGPTNLHNDVGQSTVPFIDIQPVTPKPPVPLSGIGMHWRGVKGYKSGGLIAPLVLTYDYEADMDKLFSEKNIKEKYYPKIKDFTVDPIDIYKIETNN